MSKHMGWLTPYGPHKLNIDNRKPIQLKPVTKQELVHGRNYLVFMTAGYWHIFKYHGPSKRLCGDQDHYYSPDDSKYLQYICELPQNLK